MTPQPPPCPPSATRRCWWAASTFSPASPRPSPGQTPSGSAGGSESPPRPRNFTSRITIRTPSWRRSLAPWDKPDPGLLRDGDQPRDSLRPRRELCPSCSSGSLRGSLLRGAGGRSPRPRQLTASRVCGCPSSPASDLSSSGCRSCPSFVCPLCPASVAQAPGPGPSPGPSPGPRPPPLPLSPSSRPRCSDPAPARPPRHPDPSRPGPAPPVPDPSPPPSSPQWPQWPSPGPRPSLRPQSRPQSRQTSAPSTQTPSASSRMLSEYRKVFVWVKICKMIFSVLEMRNPSEI